MILITGARGFIGSNLATYLKSCGNDVVLLSRSETFRVENDRISADLSSNDHISQLKKTNIRPDTVIHLAGHIEISLRANAGDPSSSPVPGPENIAGIYQSNLLATINLLEYCMESGVKHIIFASSQAVYGMPPSEHITEETPCNPLEHYALSKECCEKVLRLAATGSLAITVFRFPGVYSEKRQGGAVWRFCESATKAKKIRVVSDIPLPFDVIHLDDVLDAFSRAVGSKNRGFAVYNIATGEPNNLNLLADRVAGLVPGCTVEHAKVPQPIIRMDSEKAYTTFKWKAVPSLVRLKQVLDTVHHD